MRRLPKILIVDDNPSVVNLLKSHLKPYKYTISVAYDGEEALDKISKEPPDLVILDLMMPRVSGYEVCKRIKNDPETQFIPVIVITSLKEPEDKLRAIELGADDFILKPINRVELTARIKSLLRIKLLHDNLDTSESILFSLVYALEAKDQYTRGHSERVAKLAVDIGRRMGLEQGELELLHKGGLLHDIGKIGVKESILLKDGTLSRDELEHIQTHPGQGHEMCSPLKSIEHCLSVIRSHHERVDGKGYPDGMGGKEIPLHARIMAVSDAFDAMTSDRPYRSGMPKEKALAIFKSELNSGQWDPECIKALLDIVDQKS